MDMKRLLGAVLTAAAALAMWAPSALAQANAAVDQYAPYEPRVDGSGPASGGGGNAPGGGPGTSYGSGGSGGSGGSPSPALLTRLASDPGLVERLSRSGALDAPGFSNLIGGLRGVDAQAIAASRRGGSDASPSPSATPAASRTASGGGDSDRTELLLILLGLSTIGATGLGIAFRRRRGLAVRNS